PQSSRPASQSWRLRPRSPTPPSPARTGRSRSSHSPGGQDALWTMDPDGGNRSSLISQAGMPKWSPDGKTLAFVTGTNNNIWLNLANADGTNVRSIYRVQANGGMDSFAWSPDATQLVLSLIDCIDG